ncbi:uncharacterized protein LOC127161236 [Labeo rohita]|uniref:uncharacterized protein LOC127161236 n=1 Tax=Labeo rohita TaxID=84645 RepID=UPI0021E1D6ED|nr:uncharacterized protein LOC127161236 [Labeo rohita]
MERDSVTLHINVTEIQTDDEIEWTFGTDRNLIAKTNGKISRILDGPDGRFRDRLKLDHQTGSLTITNTRTTDSGIYEAEISLSSSVDKHRFSVTVYARLPVPVISSNSSQCSSSSSYCSLVCSVVNVSHVTLSWYKGNSLLFSISVSDLSISLSLPLEIERVDDSYSCVVAYSFTNRTTHLNTELCHTCSGCNKNQHLNITQLCRTCSDCVHYYDSVEAVVRLVVTALMGVAAAAAVIVLIYDIKSRRDDFLHSSSSKRDIKSSISGEWNQFEMRTRD